MSLVDGYDAALFDLDGVLYLGPRAVEGAVEAVRGVREAGVAVAYVTNNAGRPPAVVAEHLTSLGIEAQPHDVVASSQAIASELASAFPTGSRILVVGSEALADEVTAVGLTPVWSLDEDPVALVMGYNPQWRIADLWEACLACEAGLPWYASNLDRTIPSDRGILPGMGTWAATVTAASGRTPDVVAGKPCRPLMDATVQRLGCERPLFVGDRLDTDIEGAVAAGMDSLLVLSGAHGKADLVAAGQRQRPTYVGLDARALLADPVSRRPELVVLDDRRLRLADGTPTGSAQEQLEVLWALAHAAWEHPEADATSALEALDLLR